MTSRGEESKFSHESMKKPSPVSRSGRFTAGPTAEVAQFTQSISFDHRLWRQDILGSMAHATMLRKIGVLSRAECNAILKGLDAIGRQIASGKFHWREELEDVHMNIEAELTRRVPAGLARAVDAIVLGGDRLGSGSSRRA